MPVIADKEAWKSRVDPYVGYMFMVELGGITSAGFSEVSGLNVETEVETFREGGLNSFEYKIPKGTKYPDLILKRGIANDDLWEWYKDVIYGKIERKNISVCLVDDKQNEIKRWNFQMAYPVKWEGPTLNAASATVAVERVVIVHHGLEKPKDPKV